ncbi:phage portal protein [Deinococcus sp. HMF7604]|uniref:phage portal protein n=1 Tax=Deinococcus betulae TaxID=2873312 RepID=UPI001CCA7480|nr:phage portal protein [Deinococcus betulae]MBZ9753191.1 phage portal protein [Deinococcus betulae]
MTAPSSIVLPPGAAQSPTARLLKLANDAATARAGDATMALNWKLYLGDLWAGGLGWNGPLPRSDTNHPGDAARVGIEIERTFVSRNLTRDIVDRHQSGVAGREPLVNVIYRDGRAVTDAERARLAEYDGALTDWAEDSSAWLAVQAAVRIALATRQSTVRLYVHRSSLDLLSGPEQAEKRGIRTGLTLSEAARRLSVHAPEWNQSGAIRDREGHVQGAWYKYLDEQGQEHWEIQEHGRQSGQRVTVVHPDVLTQGIDNSPATTYQTPDLWIYELRLEPLISDSVRRLQRAASKVLTMGSRNIDLGGFVERTILNAQMPGEYKTGADGQRTFVPAPYNVGPGTTNFLAGNVVMQAHPDPQLAKQGKLVPTGQFTRPEVVYKDPAMYEVFTAGFEQMREAILDEANQLHVLISGDASASGVSRQQAVNDFLSSLEPTRIALEGLLRWLYEAVLRFALEMTGRIGEAQDLRVRVQARISAVQPTPAEVETAMKLHAAGLISRESAHGRIGVEDSEAEVARMAAEGITPTVAMRIAELAPAWVGLRALSLAYPALLIREEDIAAQRDLDLAPPTAPAEPDDEPDPDLDPDAGPDA